MTETPIATVDMLEDRAKAFNAVRILELPVDAIIPNPNQPRRSFTDQATPEERKAAEQGLHSLAANIKMNGLLAPILVRPTDLPGQYMIVAGERRWRAHRLLEAPRIRALVDQRRATDNPGQLLVDALTENVQREDLSLQDLVANLAAMRELFPNENDATLAARLGWTPSKFSKHVALVKLHGPAGDAYSEGYLASPDTALAFARLPAATQVRMLHQARRTGEPISRNAVDRSRESAKPARATSSDDHHYVLPKLPAEFAAALFAALGAALPPPLEAPQRLRELLAARVQSPEASQQT